MLAQCFIGAASALATTVSTSKTCDDIHDCRTVAIIVYNCASTIFLCTWVALHPNVDENPREVAWKRSMNRIGLMLGALVAPEAILVWSFNQWNQSCNGLRKLLIKYPNCGWTETHAIFAYMGGFRLVNKDGTEGKVIDGEEFFERALKGEIKLSTIKDDEILDKSKGDGIAKTIAIIQTLWFAIQAAHRVSKGLVVTALELTTLGHVALNIFIYWCWWYKPLNVRFPVDVYQESVQDPLPNEEKGTLRIEAAKEPAKGPAKEPESQLPIQQPLPFRVRIATYFDEDESARVTESFGDIIFSGIFMIFLVTSPALFGGIHCLAWNSIFPTPIEKILWRVCAVIVTVLPAIILAFLILINALKGMRMQLTVGVEFVVSIIYVLSRICLLVIALTTLRALPYKAYAVPSWTGYIPHIG